MESKRQTQNTCPLSPSSIRCIHTLPFIRPPHPIISNSFSISPNAEFQIQELSYQEAMRNQNPKTPSLKSKKPITESDASFSISKNNKSEPKAIITTHQSRQLPLLSDSRTDGTVAPARSGDVGGGCCGRERLKRHWMEVAGRVWIPDIWGQEDLLKDWIDCSAFESSLVGSSSIMSARESLVEQGQRELVQPESV